MPDCELAPICPVFNNLMYNKCEIVKMCREQYCNGNYAWCGRYMIFKALERELKREKTCLEVTWKSMGQQEERLRKDEYVTVPPKEFGANTSDVS